MRKLFKIIFFAFPLLFVLSCNKEFKNSDPRAFRDEIIAYTRGTISSSEDLFIVFKDPILSDDMDFEHLLSITPSVKGSFQLKNKRELHFTPDPSFIPGKEYKVHVDLETFFPDRFDHALDYTIQIIPQHLAVEKKGVKIMSNGDIRYLLNLLVAQEANIQNLKKCIESNATRVELVQNGHNSYIADLIFENGLPEDAFINYNGEPIFAEAQGEVELFDMDLFEEFNIIYTSHEYQEGKFQIYFSRRLKMDQDLLGLIRADQIDCDYSIQDNQLTVYLPDRLQKNEITLTLDRALLSEENESLRFNQEFVLQKKVAHPSVQFVDSGNYIPTKGNVYIPIRTRNLKEVQIEIIEVPKENVHHFMSWQGIRNNSMDFLTKLGRPIYYETVKLPGAELADPTEWEQFGLDLTKKFVRNPGALYTLNLRFGPQNTYISCDAGFIEQELHSTLSEMQDRWNKSNDYYYYDYSMWRHHRNFKYTWQEELNPCEMAYYWNLNRVSQTVMASDLGIIVKQGEGHAAVSVVDMHTLDQISGAQVQLYDYQGQVLGQAKSNKMGLASFALDRRATSLSVRHQSQEVMMDMHQNYANNLSSFPISGSERSKEQFFLYTERGVWRPGDSIFLNVMLNRRQANYPEGMPLVVEFFNHKSNLIDRKKSNIETGKNIYSFKLSTELNAETGTYQARVSIGPTVINKSIPIENIRPNDVEVKYNFKKEEGKVIKSNLLKGNAHVQYLNGFALKNANVQAKTVVQTMPRPFESFKEYRFSSSRTNSEPALQLFKQSTDDQGNINLNIQSDFKQFNGKSRLKIETEMQLPGGGVNISSESFMIDPFMRYVGIKQIRGSAWGGSIEAEEKVEIPVLLLDREGERTTGSHRLSVSLHQYVPSWWLDKYNLSRRNQYRHGKYWKHIGNYEITSQNGAAVFEHILREMGRGTFNIKIADIEDGHEAEINYTIYDAKRAAHPTESSNILMVELDKEICNSGESVTLKYPSFNTAKVLISIEQGDRIIDQFWKNISPNNREIILNPDDRWTPNVYIHSTLIQAYEQEENNRPLRMYSILPLQVNLFKKRLEAKLEVNEKVETGVPFYLKVSEKSKKSMEYTLAVVDEGLLNITGFQTPDPEAHFNSKIALRVNTWDIYSALIKKYHGDLSGILSIGGDDAYVADVQADFNRFKSVVKFFGPFKLDPGEVQKHEMTADNFIGELRVMLIACNDIHFGMEEKKLSVRSPIMLQTQFPRALNVTDQFNLPVTVFKDELGINKARVEAKVKTGKIEILNNNLEVDLRNKDQNLGVLSIEVKDEPGTEHLELTARANGKSMKEETQIFVNFPKSYQSVYKTLSINKGQEQSFRFNPKGYENYVKYKIKVSGVKLPDFTSYAEDLIEYPYGCLEQTVSKGFSQLFLDEILQLSPEQKQNQVLNVQSTLTKLQSFQDADGSFYQWPGSRYYHAWSESYLGYFLAETKDAGFRVPERMLDDWQRAQTERANQWVMPTSSNEYVQESEEMVQAFRLFVLAKTGSPVLGAMNRFVQGMTSNTMNNWLLAGSYALAGYDNKAEELMNKAIEWSKNYQGRYSHYTYGGHERNLALIVDILYSLGNQHDLLQKYYFNLIDKLNERRWASTQTKAFSFLAATRFLDGNKANFNGEISFSIDVNGNKKELRTNAMKTQVFEFSDEYNGGTFRFENLGDALVYLDFVQRYLPKNLYEEPKNSELSILATIEGKSLSSEKPNITVNQGDEISFYVEVGNETSLALNDLALNVKMPSGFELLNPRIFKTVLTGKDSSFDYQDYKDDRVYTFFSLEAGRTKKFYFKAKAAFQGDFYLPSVRCEHMYNGDVFAETYSGRLKIQ